MIVTGSHPIDEEAFTVVSCLRIHLLPCLSLSLEQHRLCFVQVFSSMVLVLLELYSTWKLKVLFGILEKAQSCRIKPLTSYDYMLNCLWVRVLIGTWVLGSAFMFEYLTFFPRTKFFFPTGLSSLCFYIVLQTVFSKSVQIHSCLKNFLKLLWVSGETHEHSLISIFNHTF